MTYGAKFFDASGNVTFDSSQEHTLFLLDEVSIPAASVGSGLTYSYSGAIGKKITAFIQSPYGGDYTPGEKIQRAQISYPGGVPTVSVTFEDPDALDGAGYTYPKANGYLSVFLTGASQ